MLSKATQAQPQVQPGRPQISTLEAAGLGARKGVSLGLDEEIGGAIAADRYGPRDPMDRILPRAAVPPKDSEAVRLERYRAERDRLTAQNEAAREQHKKTFIAGQVLGGLATAPIAPGVNTLKGAAALGGTYGLISGAADSKGDLTKGEVGQVAKDSLVGGGVGVLAGAGGYGLAKLAGAVAGPLTKTIRGLGRARLFKAAVGQNKRAFTQMDGKGLFEKAGEYLDDIGIGFGDTTESIGAKLAKRADQIEADKSALVTALDEATPASVSPLDVAQRIEKEVAEPLKKLAANQAEYKQAMSAIDDVLGVGKELTFAEAAQQRAAFQQLANYNRQGNLPASEEINRKIAQIWNDVIDEKAAPILEKLGEDGTAYRELRHEQQLALELLGHVNNRVQGNAANRVISPSDYGMGGAAGIMTGNPYVGVAAAVSNHLARKYGNAAAGRAAINIAKFAEASPQALRSLMPSVARAMKEQEAAATVVPAFASRQVAY